MEITNVLFSHGYSSFYYDDQAAIKNGARQDGFMYLGQPLTPGFAHIRQPGESISIMLELENGSIAQGDCVAVQYSGAGGRDPIFVSDSYINFLEQHIAPVLIGRDIDHFKSNSQYIDGLKINGQRLHTALQYGISQAFLSAAALASGRLKSEVVCDEYDLPYCSDIIKLLGQSGDDRYAAADKMIIKGVDTLPHGLINSPEKLGEHGESLSLYIMWLKDRIDSNNRSSTYRPNIHIDVYGTIGNMFDQNPIEIAEYLNHLQELCGGYQLYIEGPVDAGSKFRQIKLLKDVKRELDQIGSRVKIVADEWCNDYEDVVDFVDTKCCDMVQIKTPDLGAIHNTVDAILYCHQNNVEAYQGGTCNETDVSAQVCTHLAMAARPSLMLIKPGMGFDEGFTIVMNEMNRTAQLLKSRKMGSSAQGLQL